MEDLITVSYTHLENTQPSQSVKQETSSKENQGIRKLLPISLKLQEEWYFCCLLYTSRCV